MLLVQARQVEQKDFEAGVIVGLGEGVFFRAERLDVEFQLVAGGAELGLLKVRLYRPFDSASLIEALPASVRTIAVLRGGDRV